MKAALLFLFWGMWYLAFSTRTSLAPFLPMIQDEFALTHSVTGGLLIFIAAGQGLGYFYAGPLATRVGSKKPVAVSFVAAAASLVGLYFASSYNAMALWLFLFGVCGGIYLPCAIPLLTAAFDREHWGKAISFHETAAGLSILTIPYLAALLLTIMTWRESFLVLAAVFALVVPVFWLASSDGRNRPSEEVGMREVIRRPELWIIMTLWVLSVMGSIGVYSILPLFLVSERGMSVETANRVLSISRIGGFAGQIAVGFLLDRFDTGKIILLLMLMSGLAAIGLGLAGATALLIAMLFLQASFCVVFFPVGIVAIAKLTSPVERGVFAGIIMSISTIVGCGLTPFLLGLIADLWRFQHGFVLLGLLNIAALLPALKLARRLAADKALHKLQP
jgi:MFS transporter, NNP family, nitrate/nitrite transporter